MNKSETKKKQGISIALLHGILSLLAVALTVTIIVTTNVAANQYEAINQLTDGYIRSTHDIEQLDETSDMLTNKAKEYVVTGNAKSANKYIEEIEVMKTREKSVENIKNQFGESEVYTLLQEALKVSDQLAETEVYAIRLAAETYGIGQVPETIRAVTLTKEDLALPANEKREKAITLLFSDEYDSSKATIDNNIDQCLLALIRITNEKKDAANKDITGTITAAGIVGFSMLLIILVLGTLTYLLLLKPLKENKKAIEEGEAVQSTGCQELRFVADSYNEMFRLQQKQRDALQYEVSHDILTGIPNRHEYIAASNKLADSEAYFVIADVDHFKAINDTYGHAIGDQVLSEVARRLREAFLNHDRVFRIGGDEFVIVALDVSDEKKESLKQTLLELNRTLLKMHEKHNFPNVSLSFGISKKTPHMTFDESYRSADKALYQVKSRGGHDVAFAKEE